MNVQFLAVLLTAVAAAPLGAGPPALQRFDQLWRRRDENAVAAKLAIQARQFAASSSYEELWRATSWYVWVAGSDLPTPDLRQAALAGVRAGKRALEEDPEGIEGKYWTALSVGLYASTSNPLVALTLDLSARFRDPLQEVIRADAEHENAHVEWVGAEVALGALYEHLPWPTPNRDRARAFFEEAVRARPENLRAHYMLGEFLRDQDRAAARREIELVLAGDEGYDPPDARRQKRKAAALLQLLR